MLGSLLLAATLAAGAAADPPARLDAPTGGRAPFPRVVLRSGQAIALAGDIRIDGGKVLFRSPAGVLYSIAVEEVDFEAMERTKPAEDPIEKLDQGARHPVKKLNVSREERDRLLAELSKKQGDPRPDPEVLSPGPPKVSEPGTAAREATKGAEDRWRAEARAARAAVATREAELRELRARAQQLEDQLRTLLSSGYDPNTLSAQAEALDLTRNRIDATEKALRGAQRDLADLQDRARKTGVMPGWLRD